DLGGFDHPVATDPAEGRACANVLETVAAQAEDARHAPALAGGWVLHEASPMLSAPPPFLGPRSVPRGRAAGAGRRHPDGRCGPRPGRSIDHLGPTRMAFLAARSARPQARQYSRQ